MKLSKEISALCVGRGGSRIDADISHLLSLEWLEESIKGKSLCWEPPDSLHGWYFSLKTKKRGERWKKLSCLCCKEIKSSPYALQHGRSSAMFSRRKKKFCANVFTCHVKDNLCLDCLRFVCKKFPTTGLRDGYDDENFNQSLVVSKKLHQLKVLREAGSHEPGWKTE